MPAQRAKLALGSGDAISAQQSDARGSRATIIRPAAGIQIVFHALPLDERAKLVAGDDRAMKENVAAAGRGGDKAAMLIDEEFFDGSCWHASIIPFAALFRALPARENIRTINQSSLKRSSSFTRLAMPSAEMDFDNNAAPNAEGGLSLDDLNAAFAGMLSGGDDPYSEPSAADDTLAAKEVVAGGEGDEDGDTGCDITPLTILESMLFVGGAGGEPLTSRRVSSLMRGVRPAEIDDLVRDLNDRYDADGRPYRIENAGEGYRLTLREEFSAVVDKLQGRNRQARLTPAAIEVLSLVAYNGPQTADDLTRLRGRPSGAVLSQLVRRQLLSVERDETDRRLTRYVTTPRFLAVLGIEKLDDLPRSQDVERR